MHAVPSRASPALQRGAALGQRPILAPAHLIPHPMGRLSTIVGKIESINEYSSSRIDMRADDVLISAEGRLAAGCSELTVSDELVLNDPGGPMPCRLSACQRPGLASLCGHACRVAVGVIPAFSVTKDRARYVGLLEAGGRDR